MPGPVSDSYDPEWGTSSKAGLIVDAVREQHESITEILDGAEPIYIGDLVNQRDQRTTVFQVCLTEWQLRILRFACERAGESI